MEQQESNFFQVKMPRKYIQDNCEDIYAGAVQINDDRKAAAAEYEDESATEDVELEEAKSEESECGCGCSEQ